MFSGMSLRLHYRPGTASMARHSALAEIGVEYELVEVVRDDAGRSSADYLALNPSGKIRPPGTDRTFALTSCGRSRSPASAG
jgi:hypothetical protein